MEVENGGREWRQRMEVETGNEKKAREWKYGKGSVQRKRNFKKIKIVIKNDRTHNNYLFSSKCVYVA